MGKQNGFTKDIYENEYYKVVFEEDDEAYFYALKDGDDVFFALKINVLKKDNSKYEPLSMYHKVWDKPIERLSISSFIRRFLESPASREENYCDGVPFIDVLDYSDSDGINKKCKSSIKRFKKIPKDKRKFKDYCNIKTFGVDKFSRMKLELLMERLDEQTIKQVNMSFEDEKSIVGALRWCCRGLDCDDAIRKVKTDLEVAQNARRY